MDDKTTEATLEGITVATLLPHGAVLPTLTDALLSYRSTMSRVQQSKNN